MPVAYIGMGANLTSPAGPPDATMAAAASRLKALGRIVAQSSLYSTEPMGFANQPHFINAVVALETEFAPYALLDRLLNMESEFGRDRSKVVRNGPRTLDLDILLFGDIQLREPRLEIPHPRLAERAFALVPLHEIAPQAVDPVSRKTVAQLLHALRASRENDFHEVVPIPSLFWTPGVRSSGIDRTSSRRAEIAERHSHR